MLVSDEHIFLEARRGVFRGTVLTAAAEASM